MGASVLNFCQELSRDNLLPHVLMLTIYKFIVN